MIILSMSTVRAIGVGSAIGRCVLFVLLLNACAATPTKPVPGAEAIAVPAPTFKVGEEWRWQGGSYPTFAKVLSVEGEQTVVETNVDPECQKGCQFVLDKNLVIIRATDEQGQPAYASGLKMYDFPLRVGKQWSQRLNQKSMDGPSAEYINRWKVEEFEEITVKAGTFRAFRISWYQENLTYPWRGNVTLWWSPDAKAIVKRVVHTSGWGRNIELASYAVNSPHEKPVETGKVTTRESQPVREVDEVLTNDMILSMVKAGVDDSVILLKIKSTQVRFDTRAEALAQLRRAGVSNQVLSSMIEKSHKSTQ